MFYLIVAGAVAIFVIGMSLQVYSWLDAAKVQRKFEGRMDRSLDAMDQGWFTTGRWQAGETAADADLAARTYAHEDTFLAALDALPAVDRR